MGVIDTLWLIHYFRLIMRFLPQPYRALVIGSTGAIGQAWYELLAQDPTCQEVIGIHRQSTPAIDYANLASIEHAANLLAGQESFHLIINATGVLHSEHWRPEKKLADLNAEQLLGLLQTNTVGPALTLKSFAQLLQPTGGVFVTLSAKVGSIEDNRLGGWYSYRASKAALNMLIKTSAIELRRTRPQSVVIAMHPGTVNSRLSQPFKGEQIGRPASVAVLDMMQVLQGLTPEDSGCFFSYNGAKLPW